MPVALLAALIGSLSLHAAALFLPDIDLSVAPEPPPLTAELKPLPKPPEAEVEVKKAVDAPHPRPRPKAAKAESAPAVVQAPAGEPQAVAAQALPEAAPAPKEEPPAVLPPADEPRLPSNGHIRFVVYRGNQGFEVGRAEHVWAFSEGSYRLTAVTETAGLAALFKPVRIELESRGKVTAQGLQPERFSTRRNGAETNENADFDWPAHQVTLARDGSHHDVRDGAQDLLSFHYQLGYLARLVDGATMGVASGKKFERYHFDAAGEEEITTPAGPFRTLHVRVQTDSTTELWLALDRYMLPVKIRYTDRKGESFEQVATELGN